MKRLVTTSILLALIAVLMYISMMYALNHISFRGKRLALSAIPYLQRTGGQEEKMFSDLVSYSNPEIVVIGSSHAYRGYDPRIFQLEELDMINTGTSSQHSLASYILTRKYWNYESKPTYIIDVYPQVFMDDGIECSTRLIQNVPDHNPAWSLVTEDPDLRSFNAYMARLCCDRTISEFSVEDYVSRGYCSDNDTLQGMFPAVDSTFVGQHKYFDYLHRLITYLESEGSIVVLVNQPMPINSDYQKFNDSFNKDLQRVLDHYKSEGFSHDRRKVVYFDMAQDVDFDVCCDFSDPKHLNQGGVEKFNYKLIGRLRSEGLLGPVSVDGSFSMLSLKR
ncbi:MAG: hypothetical protein SGI87_12275 [Flavobacteriales bacterium]|nr:hypothetical protein [Flavobacteriales bacterium]